MNRNLGAREHPYSSNDESARKRPRLDEQPADDDFPDGDLTVEEFDFCLTQVTDATLTQAQVGHASAAPSTSYNGAANRDLLYSLEGQVQLLGRKVATLTRDLHQERLSKQEELRTQADLHSKEVRELKSQVEFKEGELRSVISKQTALEEKLRGHGVETRYRQVVDAGTSTTLNDPNVPEDAKARNIQPTRTLATALRNPSDRVTWLGHEHALCPLSDSWSTPTHLDVIRNYVNDRERSIHSADVVTLSLQCLSDAISEAAMEASSAGFKVPAEKLVRSSTAHNETLVFDVLADLARSSDPRLASLSVVALQRLAESSAAQPCIQALQKREYMAHLAGGTKLHEDTAIPLVRLAKAALETTDGLAPLCCPVQAQDACLWRTLSKPFEQDEVGTDLLCEVALLAQQVLGCEHTCWICFDEFVGSITTQFGNMLERLQGSMRHESLLLSCLCIVAQARPWHKQRVGRLVVLCRSRVEGIDQVWPFFEEDGN